MKNSMFPTTQPERNLRITRSQFKAAYSAARRDRVKSGLFAGMASAELSGPGYYWTTPSEVAAASLSIRRRIDYVCNGGTPFQKLNAIRDRNSGDD